MKLNHGDKAALLWSAPMPLALSDIQMQMVQAAAELLHPDDRGRFLKRVAELLNGHEIGDGGACGAPGPARIFQAAGPRGWA